MSGLNCSCKCTCILAAVITSAIVGILAAFFQITGTITVTTAFLWVVFGIAVVYLGVLTVAVALAERADRCDRLCSRLNLLLIGILGAILLAVVLLAFGIIATSVVSAILVGLLLFFFTLVFTGSACLIRCLAGCSGEVSA